MENSQYNTPDDRVAMLSAYLRRPKSNTSSEGIYSAPPVGKRDRFENSE